MQKLNRLVLRACQPDPAQRFEHAGQMLASLEAPEAKKRLPYRHYLAWLTCFAIVEAIVVGWRLAWHKDVTGYAVSARVEANFLSEPFDAAIYLDGKPLVNAKGEPLKTPCTVADVPSGEHHVVFWHVSHGELNAGRIDFAKVHEVEVPWPAEKESGRSARPNGE